MNLWHLQNFLTKHFLILSFQQQFFSDKYQKNSFFFQNLSLHSHFLLNFLFDPSFQQRQYNNAQPQYWNINKTTKSSTIWEQLQQHDNNNINNNNINNNNNNINNSNFNFRRLPTRHPLRVAPLPHLRPQRDDVADPLVRRKTRLLAQVRAQVLH